MQGAANKMLLVDAGSVKDLISQQMKNTKRRTARLMQLRRTKRENKILTKDKTEPQHK